MNKDFEKFVHVNSSCIATIGYSFKYKVLRIVFKHERSVYDYQGVSSKVYDNMSKADSVGKYFHENIQGNYLYEVVSNYFSKCSLTNFDLNENETIIYVVYENSDLVEGKGCEVIIGYFSNYDVAKYVKDHEDKEVFRSTHGKGIIEIKVNNARSVEEYLNSKNNAIRERALSKLTEDEKKALGLI
jgi:hypothetical protein